MWCLPFLPSEEQWSALSAAFHKAAMSFYQRKCIHSPLGLWLRLSIPHGAVFKISREKNGIRLWGRLWALSTESWNSPPQQTLITHLRWIKRIWLTTIQLLFYVMPNHLTKHWGVSRGGGGSDGVSLGFGGRIVNPTVCHSLKLVVLLLCYTFRSQLFFRFFMSL